MTIFYLAIHAAAHAWNRRTSLLDNNMEMAVLSHNQAVSDMIQTQASHYTTALDIVCANYHPCRKSGMESARVNKRVKKSLKTKIEDAVDVVEGLTQEQKEAYTRILSARVDQGLAKGFVAKLEDLLVDLGVVGDQPPAVIRARIRFIDTLRNAIIHRGRLPRPDENESRQALGQRVAGIVYQILPEINNQVFYRVLGFSDDDLHKFGFDTNAEKLRLFFEEGSAGPTIEDVSDLRILEKLLQPVDESDDEELESEQDDGDEKESAFNKQCCPRLRKLFSKLFSRRKSQQ